MPDDIFISTKMCASLKPYLPLQDKCSNTLSRTDLQLEYRNKL